MSKKAKEHMLRQWELKKEAFNDATATIEFSFAATSATLNSHPGNMTKKANNYMNP